MRGAEVKDRTDFFFEKKKQKTFASWGWRPCPASILGATRNE
jgi:hypothetical protein